MNVASRKKMKVLFVEPFAHREGHPPNEPKRIGYPLIELGAEVSLVTFIGVRGDWINKEGKLAHISFIRPRKFPLRFYQYLDRFLITRSLCRYLETLLTLSLAIWENRKHKYDLIHILDADPTFFFPLAFTSLLKSQKLILVVYNPPPPKEDWRAILMDFLRKRDWKILAHLARYELGEARLSVFLRKLLYRRAVQNNNFLLVCHTEQIKDSYATYLGGILRDRFVCIPLGVENVAQPVSREYARQCLSLPLGKKIFLSFGNNHPGKDFKVVFQALKNLSEDNIILHVGKLGPSGIEHDPQGLAHMYDYCASTIIKDAFVPEEEKMLYFTAADAVILSYKKDFIQSASILNDAAKLGTPVIASDVGQLGEFVRSYHLGITFAPEDANSLQQAIMFFLALPDKEKQVIKENFAKFAAARPQEENARSHVAAYQRVLEG